MVIVLLHADLGKAVENRRIDAPFVMIGIGAEIESRHGRDNAAENVGVALDPRAGAELRGLGWRQRDGGEGESDRRRC